MAQRYTMRQVWEHQSANDCWVVIHGEVYDVSKWLKVHPGGESMILQAAGNDATVLFEDWNHSKEARDILKKFHIGKADPEEQTRPYWAYLSAAAAMTVVLTFLYMKHKM